jgi:hypothetical protein
MGIEMIPNEMKSLNQWVCWSLVERQGKKTKLPINPHTGKLAKSDDPATWASYEQALAASKNFNGIGFVFTASDPFCGIDMDGHIDRELIDYFGSYAERSQSGNGAHIICKAKIERGRRNAHYEIYTSRRYFVMTGDCIHPEPIADCQEQVDIFIEHIFEPSPSSVNLGGLIKQVDNSNIVDRIMASAQGAKFSMLWRGDISEHGSASEADAALLSILRFWTGGNQADSFALFRQSGLNRAKWNREDYRERTWAAIDKGDVWQEPEQAEYIPLASLPRIMIEADLSPWRKVSTEDVQEAIKDSILADVVDILRASCDPPLLFEIGFAKALPFIGACLASPRTDAMGCALTGINRANIAIETSGGQALNMWTMIVAESAAGKDIGTAYDQACRELGLMIGTSGSEEGIADAYVENGNGILNISEFKNWLDKRHWQSRAASFLTHSFNKGHFLHVMSKRSSGDAPKRESSYCYPSIFAAVQPDILHKLADTEDLHSGFLSRFLIIRAEAEKFFPYPRTGGDDGEDARRLIEIGWELKSVTGRITPPYRYQKSLVDEFNGHSAKPKSTWARICNEYLPRLAIMISLRRGDMTPRVDEESLARAGVVCRWLFANAERCLRNIHEDRMTARFEAGCERAFNIIKSAGESGATATTLNNRMGKGTRAKERAEILQELLSRGLVLQAKEGKTIFYIASDKV